jgi:hypothetical protein
MDPWQVDPKEAERRAVRAPRPGHADLAGGSPAQLADLRTFSGALGLRDGGPRRGGAVAAARRPLPRDSGPGCSGRPAPSPCRRRRLGAPGRVRADSPLVTPA